MLILLIRSHCKICPLPTMTILRVCTVGNWEKRATVFVWIYQQEIYLKKITLPHCLFVKPIAAHDFTIYLFDTSFYAAFKDSSWEEHCQQSMTHCSERRGQEVGNATPWFTADSNWRTWLLLRGWAGWWQYAKFSPHWITERKRRTSSYSWSVLLSNKLICMWAFSSPLKN